MSLFIFILTVSMAFRLVDMEKQSVDFCVGEGQQLLIADFNGDKRSDLFCHQKTDGSKTFLYAKTDSFGFDTAAKWEWKQQWCVHKTGEIHLGDFNADGRMDLLCHDTANATKWIALADASGKFAEISWTGNDLWCWQSTGRLYTADFNGDGRTDLLCHDHGNGYVWIALAASDGTYFAKHFTATSWEKNMKWCFSQSSKVFFGDFNGDNKTDMMCTDSSDIMKMAFADNDGFFKGKIGEKEWKWCRSSDTKKVLIGFFNRDRRSDIVCHYRYQTSSQIGLLPANNDGQISEQWFIWIENVGSYTSDCSQSGPFGVGDFDGNGQDDWLCKENNKLSIWPTK